MYIMAFRFSKYLSKICLVLAIFVLIFVYFVTLNGTKTKEVVSVAFSNHKTFLSTYEKKIEGDDYNLNKGKIR